jgi:hypothetical protein
MLLPLKWQAWSDNLTTPKKKEEKSTHCHYAMSQRLGNTK